MLKLKATRLLEPPPRIPPHEWLEQHVVMPAGTETAGMPFSMSAFPHTDGPLAAFHDPAIRRIVLQWGTRLGKTTLCLSLMCYVAGVNPRNMMFASSTKDSSARVVASRLYPILAAADGVRQQLPPEHRRSVLHVRLQACRIFVGWSGSETSLADVGAYFGVANEIDKWDENVSTEADSLALFINRFKGFTDHKIVFESTPTIKGRSRIERELQASNRHRRYVPCPHCGEFQILRKGEESRPGGIKWERDERGRSDPDLAFKSAWYECERCEGRIDNHHRVPMLRRGVWCPDGCTVDRDGQVIGTAIKAGSDVVGFGPLPSWYALTETWGSFARAWIRAQKRPRDLQDVVNSYMAETWEARVTKSTPELVGDRLCRDYARGTVPAWVQFLTIGVDRQKAAGGFCPWLVIGHGPEDRAALIDWGQAKTLDEAWEKVIRADWPSEQPVAPAYAARLTAVDSSWDPRTTYAFVNTHDLVIAVKGSARDLGEHGFENTILSEPASGANGQKLTHVGTYLWEGDVERRLYERSPEDPGGLSLPKQARGDLDLLNDLCNAELTDRRDQSGDQKLLYVKREEDTPNDWRDDLRYALCARRIWDVMQSAKRRTFALPRGR